MGSLFSWRKGSEGAKAVPKDFCVQNLRVKLPPTGIFSTLSGLRLRELTSDPRGELLIWSQAERVPRAVVGDEVQFK